jgi:Ca2+-binding RTX toxin-like protein
MKVVELVGGVDFAHATALDPEDFCVRDVPFFSIVEPVAGAPTLSIWGNLDYYTHPSDWFSLTVNDLLPDQTRFPTYTFDLDTGLVQGIQPDIVILDSNHNVVDYPRANEYEMDAGSPWPEAFFDFTPSAAGTYYILVSIAGGPVVPNTTTGGYFLNIAVSEQGSRAQGNGGFGDDQLFGDIGNETIYGYAGDDTIDGDVGNDTLIGDDGADILNGGDGNDFLYGDEISAFHDNQPGDEDTLYGGAGDDYLDGGRGDNLLIGGAGADALHGGWERDTASYETAATGVTASLSSPATNTGDAAGDTYDRIDNLTGSGFDDRLGGDDTANVLKGGAGNDVLTGGLGADLLDGGAGVDTASYVFAALPVVADLTNPSLNAGGAAGDTYVSIEQLVGSSGADTLRGDAAANAIEGGAGNDILDGRGGSDLMIGGLGDDSFLVDNASDNVIDAAGGGVDAVTTSVSYTLAAGQEIEVLRTVSTSGMSAIDLTGNGFATRFVGNKGANVIDGGAGSDAVDYGYETRAVFVSLNGATIANVAVGGVLEDTIRNIENVYGGSAGDVLIGDAIANVLTGAGGDDSVRGGLGVDSLDGGAGFDTADYSDKTAAVAVTLNKASWARVKVGVVAEDWIRNIENIYGGSAGDTLTGDGLADLFRGGLGVDTLDGGDGLDTADYSDKTAAVAVTLNGASPARVTVGVVAEDWIRNIENIYGGSAGDTLTGDGLANLFRGGAGLDTLDGGAGVDTADYSDKTLAVAATLNGATAAVVKVGGVAEDTIRNVENINGGAGADVLVGDGLANLLYGGEGNDVLRGGAAADTLDGGAGTDWADYSEKTTAIVVTLKGAVDVVVKVGGAAEDTIRNIECIAGGSAADTLTGDDLANLFRGGAGVDTLDGGAGVDWADYREKTSAVAVTLNGATSATVKVGGVAEDNIRNIESIYGGSAADLLLGDWLSNQLSGGAGNDLLKGGAGADALDGGAGSDWADYRDKAVSVTVALMGATNAVVTVGGVAEDTIRNIEYIAGGWGADRLTGDGTANLFRGGAGADTLDGGAGSDTADYTDQAGAVSVTLNGANYATVSVGGAAEDAIRNIENIYGGAGSDVLLGDGLANALLGGGGNDVLTGGAGADAFVFASLSSGLDTISDFTSGSDHIDVSAAGFGGGLVPGGAAALATGARATANHAGAYFIYEITAGQGALYFDANGGAGADAVAFARLTGAPTLAAVDLHIRA